MRGSLVTVPVPAGRPLLPGVFLGGVVTVGRPSLGGCEGVGDGDGLVAKAVPLQQSARLVRAQVIAAMIGRWMRGPSRGGRRRLR